MFKKISLIVFLIFVVSCVKVKKDESENQIDKQEGLLENPGQDKNGEEGLLEESYLSYEVGPSKSMKRKQMGLAQVSVGRRMGVSKKIGVSTGGAKDINNFRENIANNYLPLPTDITYEGLFYDYFFDTGQIEVCKKLFCPSYTSAISKDPFSQKEKYFLSVGLNSGIEQKDFSRPKLNLVIVIDISGSMGSPFDHYYYDNPNKQKSNGKNIEKELLVESKKDFDKTKLQVAGESVSALISRLNPDDSFGVVLFDDSAYLGQSIKKVKSANLKTIKKNILKLEVGGGTNMSAGMQKASQLFENYSDKETKTQNRIIFLTDAQPNTGETNKEGLLGMVKDNVKRKIYTSFIGVGVDFNTELIEFINKQRGANYYSVHSPLEFKKRLDKEFDFMVTPLAFNLELKLQSEAFKIEKVYGSPEADLATGEIMKVATLFPSERTNNKTRGGLVLLQLEKISSVKDHSIQLTASYEDGNEKEDSHSVKFEFKKTDEFYDNKGIRKGILLVRYANILKNWIISARKSKSKKPTQAEDYKQVFKKRGLVGLLFEDYQLSKWERQSMKLFVSDEYKKIFKQFYSYFKNEMKKIGDSSLDKELKVLKKLSDSQTSSSKLSPTE